MNPSKQPESAICRNDAEESNNFAGTYIPATQRPDGTWRKARRVKDGYVPQEEMPLYESKGKQWAKSRSSLPPGMTPAKPSNTQDSATQKTIPGLNALETVSKSSKKKKKKKPAQAKEQEITEGLEKLNVSSSNRASTCKNGSAQDTKTEKKGVQPVATDPAKRIRNLKKKLREIECLKEKIESGELTNPEKDQLEKISRKEEIEAEIEDLELELNEYYVV